MALLLCGRRSARRWPAAALLLFAGAALTGGVGMLPVRGVLPPCRVAAGLAGFAALLPLRRRLQTTWRVGVRCAYGGHNVRFSALIDTGNRLREPLSGLPVMIVEKRLLPHCPPREDCRQVAYGALSGNGTLQCFRPDAVWIETRRGERRAPEVWVAVFPRALPCAESALAPGEFALIR